MQAEKLGDFGVGAYFQSGRFGMGHSLIDVIFLLFKGKVDVFYFPVKKNLILPIKKEEQQKRRYGRNKADDAEDFGFELEICEPFQQTLHGKPPFYKLLLFMLYKFTQEWKKCQYEQKYHHMNQKIAHCGALLTAIKLSILIETETFEKRRNPIETQNYGNTEFG